MSSGYKVTLESCCEAAPLVASLTWVVQAGGKPFCVAGGVRIWRIDSGEWYKPNGQGRCTMIDKKLHAELDAMIRKRKIKTVYGTEFYPWRKIKVDFIQEITK